MNHLGDHFLARSVFPRDQQVEFGVCHARCGDANLLHRGRLADNQDATSRFLGCLTTAFDQQFDSLSVINRDTGMSRQFDQFRLIRRRKIALSLVD